MTTAYGDWIYYTSYCALRVKWDYTDAGASCAVTATLQRWDRYANAAQGSATLWMTDSGSNNASFAANGNNETKDVVSLGSHTFSKSHSTYSISATAGTSSYFACITDSGYYRIGEQMPTWYFTIPTKWNYAVSYNANGGTGAPSSDTKWHDEALTLSSSTPSKEGHTFGGWNTNSSGTGTNYAAGASYTENAPLSLYAKWSINTYTVTFDANGGTGAPSAQPKTWGTALTLSANKPTRTNYKFLGWATSASATSAQYCTGSNNDQNTSYTTESDITLYAVWELAYVAPKVTNLKCFRCDDSGNAADEGTRCYISFTYVTDTNISSTNYATVTAKVGSNAATTLVAASAQKKGTNTYAGVLPDTGLSTDSTFTVAVAVTDAQGGSTTVSTILSQAFFTLDVLAEGHGLAIGKPATRPDIFELGMRTAFPDANALPSGGTTYNNFIMMESFAAGGKLAYVSTSTMAGRLSIQKIFAPTRANTTTANTPKDSTGDRSLRHLLSTAKMTTAKPEGDGHIIEMAWDNTGGWGSQLYVPNSAGPGWHVQYRPQNGSDTWSDWVRVQNVPVVLYDNASGTNGTVTLSQTAANFDHMRIYAKTNYGCVSVDVYSPNGKEFTMTAISTDDTATTTMYFIQQRRAISGTSITVHDNGYGYFDSFSNTTVNATAYMSIVRVEAWNES